MVVDTTKESICVNQIVGERSIGLNVEGDVIVPDIKPDILNTISTSGNVCIYKKDVLDGKVRLDGSIKTHVIYLADSEETENRGIQTNLDFTEIIELEGAVPGMNLSSRIDINSIEARVLNGRKLSIKANLDVNLKMFSNENIFTIKEVTGTPDIQKLSSTVEVSSLIGQGSTKIIPKDTMPIDQIDILAEILKVEMKVVNKDVKISYNKVLVKADADVKIMYLTDDGRINFCTSQIPIMGFIDIPDIVEGSLVDTEYELKNIVVKPNSEEEHSIFVEAEIEVNVSVFEKKSLSLIEDIYSPMQNLEFTKKEINTMCRKITAREVHNINEKVAVQEIVGGTICDTCVKACLTNTKVLNDRIMYEGETKINIMYIPETGRGIETKTITIPFNFNLEMPGVNAESNIDNCIDIIRQDFVLMPDRIYRYKY